MKDIQEELFGVPVWGVVMEQEHYHVNDYKDLLYKLKDTQPNSAKSNFNGFQTHDMLHTEPVFQEFVPQINSMGNKIVDLFKNRYDYKVAIDSMWGNINGHGGFNMAHIHSGDLSGVFYLQVPKDCESGIVFINPAQRSEAHRIRIPNNRVMPKSLACLFFPSWLEHYVEPNKSQEDRISISFNISKV